MELAPELGIGLFNAYLPIVAYLVFNTVLAYAVDREGFKRGADDSWVAPGDRLKTRLPTYLYLVIVVASVFVPLNGDAVAFKIGFGLYCVSVLLSGYTSVSYVAAPKDDLITTGAYRFSRNPIVLCNALLLTSVALMAGSYVYLAFLIAHFVVMHPVVLVEEKHCVDTYPDQYPQYADKVPRYIGS